jgi:DNA-binding CsgD family transcriptional regulator
MLVGREDECRQITRLLRDAAHGTSRSLVIRGDAGMGKSALLDFARTRAKSFHVAATTGVESESELAFGALVGLVRPFASYVPRLPEQQRSALDAAIAVRSASASHRLAAFAGFLSLVGIAAEDRPVLLLVDDIQWVDRSSAEAVLFVARRLGADRVGIVITVRLHEDEGLDVRPIPEIRLTGLRPDAGVELLRSHRRAANVPFDIAERLVILTQGAPLALLEVPTLLSDAQLRGQEPLPEPLPAGGAIQEAFRREISGLSRRSIEALRVLAADDVGALDAIQDALAARGLSLAALQAAERSGLVRVDRGHVGFRHPLLRSVTYHGSTPAQRRHAHRALAQAYATRDSVREAWHRAAAAPGPDESIALSLETAAADATSRGGHDSAAMALERAAELTPDRTAQARRRFQAGLAAWVGGQPMRAQRNLDLALGLTTDPILRADVQRARGRVLYAGGSLNDAFVLLLDEAVLVRDIAPDRAVGMLNEACIVAVGSADVGRGLVAARLAMTIARGADRESQFRAALALAHPLILGANTKQAMRLLRKWKRFAAEYFSPPLAEPFHPMVGTAYTYEDSTFGRQLLDTIHETARARAPDMLPQVLATLAHIEIQSGDWLLALAHSKEASELAKVLDQGATRAFALATLATVEAGMGREDARAHAMLAIGLAARTGARSMHAYASHALGLLELGRGRVEDAIPLFEQTARLMREWGTIDPFVIPWMPNLVEAYVHAGRLSAAGALTDELDELASRTGLPWAEAVTARCRGLVAADFDDHFRSSLTLFATVPAACDRARTELAYAERLRRAGRRQDARPHLTAAIETFRHLGAEPWTARAAAELGGTAEHVRSRKDLGDRLSPQELQVALLVGEGRTNREAAAALFVTAKTVEYHLGHVYHKLGIRSRTELAKLIAARDPVIGVPA